MSMRSPHRLPFHLTRRFFARFHRRTTAAFSSGNRLELLPDGAVFFADLFAALEEARLAICLEFYIVRDDATGRELADILRRAVKRGVEVRFLYDYLGSFETPAAYFRQLQKEGARCVPFNPPSFRRGLRWFDRRDHRKIVVIDGCSAYVGGINVGDEYAGRGDIPLPWRDMGVRLDGPAAKELLELFAENWEEAAATPLLLPPLCNVMAAGDGDHVAIVSGSPHHNRSRIHDAFLLALASANRQVAIETPYFIPGPRFIRALLRTARRGVRVLLILPGHCDVPLAQLVNRSSYATLLKGGVEVYERQGSILHAKVLVIDGTWAAIGSANLDQRSFHRNYEVNVIVASTGFGAQVENLLEGELSASRAISLVEHERRGWLIRLLEWLTAPYGWFL